jgi:hypothetical protein
MKRVSVIVSLGICLAMACDKPATKEAPKVASHDHHGHGPDDPHHHHGHAHKHGDDNEAPKLLPTDLHLVSQPGEASDIRWELRTSQGEYDGIPERVREELSDALFPSIAGELGELLVFDSQTHVVVHELLSDKTTPLLPIPKDTAPVAYGASTDGGHVFLVVIDEEHDATLWIMPRDVTATPISMKIKPHISCGSICSAKSVHFVDAVTIQYKRATEEAEEGPAVRVRIP